MVQFITIFFITLSVLVVGYFINLINKKRRTHIIVEIMFILMYIGVIIVALYPKILSHIENTLGISSALNFLVYLSIFVLFLTTFWLYKKTENQRLEITQLVREIAYLKNNKK